MRKRDNTIAAVLLAVSNLESCITAVNLLRIAATIRLNKPLILCHLAGMVAIVSTLDLGWAGIFPQKLGFHLPLLPFAPDYVAANFHIAHIPTCPPNDRMMRYNFCSYIYRAKSLLHLHCVAPAQLNREQRKKRLFHVSHHIL